MLLFPLGVLGEEGWRIAAALTARHIGGAVNYMVGCLSALGGRDVSVCVCVCVCVCLRRGGGGA
jgi:hypothetical protein